MYKSVNLTKCWPSLWSVWTGHSKSGHCEDTQETQSPLFVQSSKPFTCSAGGWVAICLLWNSLLLVSSCLSNMLWEGVYICDLLEAFLLTYFVSRNKSKLFIRSELKIFYHQPMMRTKTMKKMMVTMMISSRMWIRSVIVGRLSLSTVLSALFCLPLSRLNDVT